MLNHFSALINAPFGAIAISMQAGHLAVDLLAESPSKENQTSSDPLVNQTYQQIMQYLQQANSPFNLPPVMYGTVFQQRVWQAIASIPIGQTRSYGQLAEQLNSGPRAVANACGANRIPLIIPCHRVVAKNGLGGFMQGKKNGLNIKRWLLAHEGAYEYSQGSAHE